MRDVGYKVTNPAFAIHIIESDSRTRSGVYPSGSEAVIGDGDHLLISPNWYF